MVIRWINYNLNWKYQNEFRAAVLAFNRTEKPNHFNIVGCANDSQRLSMHKNVCVCGGERAPMAWVEQNKSRYISVRAQYEKQKKLNPATSAQTATTAPPTTAPTLTGMLLTNGWNWSWNIPSELPTITPWQLSNSIIIRIGYAKLVLLDVNERISVCSFLLCICVW